MYFKFSPKKMSVWFTLFFSIWFSEIVYAQSMPGVGQMFANFSLASIALTKLAWFVSFMAGVYFLILSILRLKDYAEGAGRSQVKLSGVAIIFMVSVLLIVLPTSIAITTNSLALGNNAGALMSTSSTPGTGISAAMAGVILFIQFVGHISFIRGLFIFKAIGEGDRQATIGKALIFIFAGAAAINIHTTVAILANTIAPGLSLPGGLGLL